jgi:hypothetical protein
MRDAAARPAAERGLEIKIVKARNGGAVIGEMAEVAEKGTLHG